MDQNTNPTLTAKARPKNRLTKVLLIIMGVLIISAAGVYSYMRYSVKLEKEPYSLSDRKGLYYIQNIKGAYYLYYQRPGQPSNAVLIDPASKINPADYVGKIISISGNFTENDTKVFISSITVKQ